VFAFSCLAAAYWNLALFFENETNMAAKMRAGKLVVVSISFFFSFLSLRDEG